MTGPTVLDALALLPEVAEELVVGTARDTHRAWAERIGGHPGEGIARAVYAGVGAGLRLGGWGWTGPRRPGSGRVWRTGRAGAS
jgi:hypothetical protein